MVTHVEQRAEGGRMVMGWQGAFVSEFYHPIQGRCTEVEEDCGRHGGEERVRAKRGGVRAARILRALGAAMRT